MKYFQLKGDLKLISIKIHALIDRTRIIDFLKKLNGTSVLVYFYSVQISQKIFLDILLFQ